MARASACSIGFSRCQRDEKLLERRLKPTLQAEARATLLQFELFELGVPHLDVMEWSDGREGAERARFEKPDFILLDLVMPHRSGFEVLDELKAEED